MVSDNSEPARNRTKCPPRGPRKVYTDASLYDCGPEEDGYERNWSAGKIDGFPDRQITFKQRHYDGDVITSIYHDFFRVRIFSSSVSSDQNRAFIGQLTSVTITQVLS